MSPARWFTLTAGPPCLVVACYWLTMTGTAGGVVPRTDGPPVMIAEVAAPDGLVAVRKGGLAPGSCGSTCEWPQERGCLSPCSDSVPDDACRRAAERIVARLGTEVRTVVRPPYVLAGDVPEERLREAHRRLIVPVAAWLYREYFDREPDEPVVIVLCSDEASYRRFAQVLDGRPSPAWYGYYVRDERRMVVDLSTGEGTLAHELVHALAHVDCPGLPEWFDEGLASLYEECRFSADGERLEGLSNWRLGHLREGLARNKLQPLSALAARDWLRPGREAIDYAHARYLCLYLQDRGVLGEYYRRLRGRSGARSARAGDAVRRAERRLAGGRGPRVPAVGGGAAVSDGSLCFRGLGQWVSLK